MRNYVITIGRQFGCGAHEIGTKLAKRLDIPYYDKEIIKRAAGESGFNEALFHFYDEKPTSSFLFNVSTNGMIPMTNNGISIEDQIVQYQFETIRNVAAEGSCIIIGRCADYVLNENPNMVSIFLHADDEYRLNRVINEYGYSVKDARKEMKLLDKKRAKFHDFYSDKKWSDVTTYNLSVDVSQLGIEKTVDLIEDYINKRFS